MCQKTFPKMRGHEPFISCCCRAVVLFLIFITDCNAYLLSSESASMRFDASLGQDLHRRYESDRQRTTPYIQRIVSVNHRTGVVQISLHLRKNSQNDVFMPVYIASKSTERPSTASANYVDYVSMPFLIVLPPINRINQTLPPDFHSQLEEHLNELKSVVSLVITSDRMVKERKLCFRRSESVFRIDSIIPRCFKSCKISYGEVEHPSFAIEKTGGDLVAKSDFCFDEDYGKVALSLTLSNCGPYWHHVKIKHGLNVVFHRPGLDRKDNRLIRDRAISRTRRDVADKMHFEQSLYLASVSEELEKGQSVITVTAVDPLGQVLAYSMLAVLDSRSQNMFKMDKGSGAVITATKLDREFMDMHYFRVTVIDVGDATRSATTTLQIEVSDENDHSPVFEQSLYETVLREGASVGSTVVTVRATDSDAGENSQIAYELVDDDATSETFRIDSESGVVTTRRQLDRETVSSYELIVRASDRGTLSQRKTASTTVRVTLSDDNDNYPQFEHRTYAIQVPEDVNWSVNPVVAQITATDNDSGVNGALRYTLVSGNTQGKFILDGVTGQLSVAGPLDYEETRSYRLAIRAQDGGSPPRSNTTQVLVSVLDVNDNAPRFYSPTYHETVTENVAVGTQILKVQAYDADDGSNAKINYTILGAPPNIPFHVDSETGWITAIREVDREESTQYLFAVQAKDGGNPSQAANASVSFIIHDVNDNSPKFDSESYEAVVAEDAPPGTSVLAISASDPDENARLVYQITEGNHRGRFSIAAQGGKGIISVAQPLDYRQEKRFALTLTATDSGGRSDTAAVYINVSDSNTHRPVFEQAPYSTSVLEDVPVGTTVLVVSASDGDVGDNARISYSLGLDEDSLLSEEGDFRIDPHTGAVLTAKLLDRERQAGYIISVTAKDHGVPQMSDTTDVEITVADVNDNSPMFGKDSYQATVREDSPVGTSVLTIKATDEDQGLNGRVRYTLEGNEGAAFSLDPNSGVIRTAKLLDRESVARHNIVGVAIDRGTPELSSKVPIAIDVEDINDNPPRFNAEKLELFIAENSPIGTTVGSITAEDPDDGVNAQVSYSIAGGPDAEAFSLSTKDGAAEIVLRVEVDYESSKKKFNLILRAASPPLRSDVPVEVVVLDVNDNAPILKDFRVVFNNYPGQFPKGPLGRIPAFDADVTDNLTYHFVSGNNALLLSLNENTGEIRLNPSLDTNVPLQATLEVSVSDGVNEVTAECQLSVLMVTDAMLFNSVRLRLGGVNQEEFLSPLMSLFIEGLAAVVPCQKENVFLFDIQEEIDQSIPYADATILKLSFSVRKNDNSNSQDSFYPSQFLKERIYPERALLARITTLRVLPFADDLCVQEPCLDFEHCLSVQKFGNASGSFLASDTVLFRAIHPVDTFACRCPTGFAGAKEHYLCDVEVDLCYSNPCKNNGTCVRNEGGYSCRCKEDFTGFNCETDIQKGACSADVCRGGSRCTSLTQRGLQCENCTVRGGSAHVTPFCELRTRSFSRGSFLTLPSLKQRHRFSITLDFATVEPNSLLLYNGRYNDKHDFVALELIDGRIQFSFSLGSNVSRVSASLVNAGVANGEARLDDGQWHTVHLEYVNRTAAVWLDDCDREMSLQFGARLGNYFCANRTMQHLESRCSDPTTTCHRFLDLTGPLQLGGVPSLPTSFQVTYKDFVGCIRDLRIDRKLVDLNSFVVDNGTSEGCMAKRSFCFSLPCRNGGSCEEHWKTYTCYCPVGFGGKDCEKSIDMPRHFQGDGFLVYNPSLRPIQAQWVNSLSLRTRSSDALLLAIQLGGKSSGGSEGGLVILDMVNGSLRYTYRGKTLYLNSTKINDGQWHHAEVKWMTSGIWMNVDYGRFEVIGQMNSSIQGLYPGKITVGSESSDAKGRSAPNFKGCIQDVRVDSDSNVWLRPSIENNVQEGCPALDLCTSSPCGNASRCISHWDHHICPCLKGHFGPSCAHACQYKPCMNGGTCVPDNDITSGYRCMCTAQHRGSHCQHVADGPCPSGWWGKPSCGPCHCPVHLGYDPNCDQVNGSCRCRPDHYRPPESDTCFPCDCYRIGSFGTTCDLNNGQCRCRSGVIGRRCDACPHSLAEVTLRGCEVIYDSCPRSFSMGIWWERTYFGESALQNCPTGAKGKASRKCTIDDSWAEPDLFPCATAGLVGVLNTLSELDRGVVKLNSELVVSSSKDIHYVANATSPLPGRLYGTDVLIISRLLFKVLKRESNQTGLNLSHRQDRDFLQNTLEILSHLMDPSYLPLWERIKQMGHPGPEVLIMALDEYSRTLVRNRGDTFTPPFEIVTPNIVFGMDTISALDVRSFNDTTSLPSGQMSIFLPKYNNYPARPSTFDRQTRIFLPVSALLFRRSTTFSRSLASSTSSYKTLRTPKTGSRKNEPHSAIVVTTDETTSELAAVAYVFYLTGGQLLPLRFARDVRQRWSTPLIIQSPVLSLNLFSYNNKSKNVLPTLAQPFRIRFVVPVASIHKDPQCVYWKTPSSSDILHKNSHWSTSGCTIQWSVPKHGNSTVINCTCSHLSTYAVIMDLIDIHKVPDASLAEEIITTIGLSIAILALVLALVVFCLLRGLQTNSNTIHKNLALCTLLVCIMFLVALRMRKTLVHKEFPCKLTAIILHHLYLCQFSWMLVEGLHLYRMLTEMRDINHGQMRFYYSVGYGAPAIVVGLAVGVRADEYGNPIFCWLSVYGSAIWSLVGPVCFLVMINLGIFVLAIHASVRMKEHVEDFGNLKTLLWLGIVLLPVMGAAWVLAVLAVNENHPLLYYLFSVFIAAQGIYIFLGYCIFNEKVRSQLRRSWCKGKAAQRSNAGINTSTVVSQRSSLAYHNNSFDVLHRNVGISTSSTTSRSTCKTSGSPFHPHTATSTSTPPSQCPSDFLHSHTLHSQQRQAPDKTRTSRYGYGRRVRAQRVEDPDTGEVYLKKSGDSDTESDLSLDHASLDLASSHSSDDEDPKRGMHNSKWDQQRTEVAPPNNGHLIYAPNILSTESNTGRGYNIPASLNGYSTQWSARGPTSLHPFISQSGVGNPSNRDQDLDRASVITASDNELNLQNEPSLTEAVFSRFSPPLIDADEMSSPEQLPAPDGGFASLDNASPTSPGCRMGLLIAERRMIVPPMTAVVSGNSESEINNVPHNV